MSAAELITCVVDRRPQALAKSLELLDPDERSRAARFVREIDRARFVARRAATRRIIGAAADLAPGELRWRREPDGRPVLDGRPLSFSVSHSGDLLVVALAVAGPVGVDAERMRELPNLDGLARVALSPSEWLAWQTVPRAQRAVAFLRHWTAKEAFLKALGRGLAEDPARVTAIGSTVSIDDGRPAWPMRHVQLGGHLIAVVAGPTWDRQLLSSRADVAPVPVGVRSSEGP